MPNDEILTLKEVPDLLKVAEKTVYTMAQNKEIPCLQGSRAMALPSGGHRSLDRPAD